MSVIATLRHEPLRVAARQARRKIGRNLTAWRGRRRDARAATYSTWPEVASLARYCKGPRLEIDATWEATVATLTSCWLAHRFDLLGSGWVSVEHGAQVPGLEGRRYVSGERIEPDARGEWLARFLNRPNLPGAQALWRLVDPGYRPIDWQLDFKSGYRWSEQQWYLDVPHGHAPGADIKVPWELGRMQHLPLLAVAYTASRRSAGFVSPDAYLREFRNEILDFVATNPPRFGVNWRCPMDVGIRVTNWLVAWELFAGAGARFDDTFERAFAAAVYDHARHIITNLEWLHRGDNHYLGDICGLLFAASYLPCTPETDGWLAFAVQELTGAVQEQFDADGANFESSTSYHRLSAEMVAFSTARVLGLPAAKLAALERYDSELHNLLPPLRPGPMPLHANVLPDGLSPFPAWFAERLQGMARFTRTIMRPDGRVPQIGDNDNGRFLKIGLPVKHLDHRHLVAAIDALFEPRKSEPGHRDSRPASPLPLDAQLVAALAGRTFRQPDPAGALPDLRLSTVDSRLLTADRFPGFGLYIFRSSRFYVAFRCGGGSGRSDPQAPGAAPASHAHSDQLSIEVAVDGVPVVVDSGSYLYTPLPARRREFRSVGMHNTMAVGDAEQNTWLPGLPGLFQMVRRGHGRVVSQTGTTIVGEHTSFGEACRRTLTLGDDGIQAIDECAAAGPKTIRFHLGPVISVNQISPRTVALGWAGPWRLMLETSSGTLAARDSLYSPAYGVVEASKVIEITTTGRQLAWKLRTVNGERL